MIRTILRYKSSAGILPLYFIHCAVDFITCILFSFVWYRKYFLNFQDAKIFLNIKHVAFYMTVFEVFFENYTLIVNFSFGWDGEHFLRC